MEELERVGASAIQSDVYAATALFSLTQASSPDEDGLMSEKNVETVRRVCDAFSGGDLETVFALVAPEIEWDFSHADTWLEERVYRGYDAITEFFGKWVGEWEDYRFELEEVIDAGEKAVAVIRDEGRGKSSGVPLVRRHAEVWTFRAGRVVKIEPFDHRLEALAAVGLSQEDISA